MDKPMCVEEYAGKKICVSKHLCAKVSASNSDATVKFVCVQMLLCIKVCVQKGLGVKLLH
jgi:hypothetical protein